LKIKPKSVKCVPSEFTRVDKEHFLKQNIMSIVQEKHNLPACLKKTGNQCRATKISSKHNKVSKWSGETVAGTLWTLHCGDAKAVLSQIAAGTVDCIITSPPYYCLRDYKIDGQLGKEETIGAYVQALCDVLKEAYRVLHKNGLLFLNLGDTYYSGKGESQGVDRKSNKRRFGLRPVDKSGGLGVGIQRKSIIGVPWRVALEMMTRKWVLRTPIIWHRENALPESVKDRPRRSYEYVFMFAKDRKYNFNRKPLVARAFDEDVWTIPPRPKINTMIGTALFPDELVRRCLEIGCPEGGLVLDPFTGSGTTMRVALQTQRPIIGIDLNPAFCHFILNEL
jgi:DNA modification methylase